MSRTIKVVVLLAICIIVAMGGSAMASSIESVSQSYVKAHAGEPGYILVDVRSPEVFNGKSPRKGIKGGHIPGAINFPLANLKSSSGPELEAAGITRDKTVIVYCNTGRMSQKFAEVLVEMGYPTVKNYKGGMTEWGADDSNPIEPK